MSSALVERAKALLGSMPKDTNTNAPLSARLCDWTVVVLSVWTVACHITVVLGGNLYHLMAVFACLGALLFGWSVYRGNPFAIGELEAQDAFREPVEWPVYSASKREYVVFCGIALALIAATTLEDAFRSHALTFWWASVLVLLAALFVWPQNAARELAVPQTRRGEAALWAIALFCAGASLFLHYPEPDDTFYVSLSARAAEDPSEPIMSADPMHGIPGIPVPNPVHIASSHELFVAALSAITGTEPLYIFHWVIGFYAALLVPMANSRLLKLLLPRLWIMGLIATLVVLAMSGDVHRWYGNFLVARLWVGKHIMLFVVIPLVAYYAVAFVRQPTAGRWLILAMAQIAGLGLSSTAIFTLPVVATLSALAVTRFEFRSALRVILVILSSFYVLMEALVLRGYMQFINRYLEATSGGESVPGRYPVHERWGDWFSTNFELVLGEGTLLRAFALCAMALTWMGYSHNSLMRRYLIVLPLGVLLTLLNPYLERLVVAHVTASVYWRLLWIIPIPMMMGLLLISPAQWGRRGVAAAAALLVLYAVAIPNRTAFSPPTGVSIHAPTSKHGPIVTEAARALNEHVPTGSYVIAPAPVSKVVPQFRESAFPLVPWAHYLQYTFAYRGLMPDPERHRRLRIDTLVSIQPDDEIDPRIEPLVQAEFSDALSDYAITGVCISKYSPLYEPLTNALNSKGFKLVWENRVFQVWTV